MRVIAGRLGGRNFSSPNGHRTRPMSEKLRGALFNTLGDIEGLSVLDAFGGSGGLAYEAISRGAGQVIVIDSERSAQKAIAANISALGLENKIKLINASANSWLNTNSQQFDVVLCDPPYNDIQYNLLDKLTARAKPGGVIVFSLPPQADMRLKDGFDKLSVKNYGDATLSYYRRHDS